MVGDDDDMRSIMDDLLNWAMRRPLAAAGCILGIILLVAVLNWPEGAAGKERRIAAALESGEIVEVARADDGARLWAVRRDGKTIYFSKGSVAIDGDGEEGGL